MRVLIILCGAFFGMVCCVPTNVLRANDVSIIECHWHGSALVGYCPVQRATNYSGGRNFLCAIFNFMSTLVIVCRVIISSGNYYVIFALLNRSFSMNVFNMLQHVDTFWSSLKQSSVIHLLASFDPIRLYLYVSKSPGFTLLKCMKSPYIGVFTTKQVSKEE